MKIALVIGSLDRGGTERQILEFVRATHPVHAECVVICLDTDGVLAGPVRELGARVVALGIGSSRTWKTRELLMLARRLRRERPDVVYAFSFWGYSLAMPLAALSTPRALRVAARRSLPNADVPQQRMAIALRPLADATSHVVIANSHAVGDAWGERAPRLQSRLHVVANGVAIPEGDNGRRRNADGTVSIVCVANLIHYKGHDVLLEAASQIRSSARWRLSLVGHGPERAAIERTIERLGLSDRVELLGSRADVDAILAGADVAVLASRTEGLPNAVMEAMAHGLPVVATDAGGVRELLGTGGGWIVPIDAPGPLAAALQTLIGDRGLRSRLGSEGRRIVRERYPIPLMRDRTLAVMNAERLRR